MVEIFELPIPWPILNSLRHIPYIALYQGKDRVRDLDRLGDKHYFLDGDTMIELDLEEARYRTILEYANRKPRKILGIFWKFLLTSGDRCGTMAVHIVILCPFVPSSQHGHLTTAYGGCQVLISAN